FHILFWLAVAEQCSIPGYIEIPVHTKRSFSFILYQQLDSIISFLRIFAAAKDLGGKFVYQEEAKSFYLLRTGQALLGVLNW
ncbi:hypothetical protein, partial [Acinetobacter baumannii]|uniref:hypothetical protein n=1 Tax=Acinetobacter baumannii TaxID=470 RepID=UPI001BB46244